MQQDIKNMALQVSAIIGAVHITLLLTQPEVNSRLMEVVLVVMVIVVVYGNTVYNKLKKKRPVSTEQEMKVTIAKANILAEALKKEIEQIADMVRIPNIEVEAALLSARNIQLIPGIASIEQLKAVYGEVEAEKIADNSQQKERSAKLKAYRKPEELSPELQLALEQLRTMMNNINITEIISLLAQIHIDIANEIEAVAYEEDYGYDHGYSNRKNAKLLRSIIPQLRDLFVK